MKEKLDELNKKFDNLELTIKNLNEAISETEQETKEQTEANKKIEEKISIKQKTVNLINDAPANIQKLKV